MSKDCFRMFFIVFIHLLNPHIVFLSVSVCEDIMNCKTGAFAKSPVRMRGQMLSYIAFVANKDCGCISSCRDRCCPYVSGVSKRKWVDARREDILDALISMWFLQFRKNSIPLSTATRNSYTLLFIMRKLHCL